MLHPPQAGRLGDGVLEEPHGPARPQDAAHLGEGRRTVVERAHDEAEDDGVGGAVRERQGLGAGRVDGHRHRRPSGGLGQEATQVRLRLDGVHARDRSG